MNTIQRVLQFLYLKYKFQKLMPKAYLYLEYWFQKYYFYFQFFPMKISIGQ